jgi:hypothetical protein
MHTGFDCRNSGGRYDTLNRYPAHYREDGDCRPPSLLLGLEVTDRGVRPFGLMWNAAHGQWIDIDQLELDQPA